jgi:hypothetical protein
LITSVALQLTSAAFTRALARHGMRRRYGRSDTLAATGHRG